MKIDANNSSTRFEEFINIAISLSTEKDLSVLLEKIISEARRLTNADAGTLYLVEDDKLIFKIIQNDSLSVTKIFSSETELPPVTLTSNNVAAYCAINKRLLNIKDVYSNKDFDFTGPKKYDELTGYNTRSMLVIPLTDKNLKVIGVLQLINAMDSKGKIIPFNPNIEDIISALASQAAISITNMRFIEEKSILFDSFVEAIITAVDSRSPYNVNHTKNIVKNATYFCDYIIKNKIDKFGDFDNQRIRQFLMFAWLHDIGKLGIPLDIMDKSTRLGDKFELVMTRLELIEATLELQKIKNEQQVSKEDFEFVRKAKETIYALNKNTTSLTESLKNDINMISCKTYSTDGIEKKQWLSDDEKDAMLIESGTLTVKERQIMKNHVNLGRKMLCKISFSEELQNVPDWVGMHHEFLDGSGYPFALTGTEIPFEVRLLTILDIFDALTTSDRPYRNAMSLDSAISILRDMSSKGKLDGDILEIVIESLRPGE